MPARAACLRRRPRAPDVAPVATARLGFCQFCRFLAGLMIGGHTLVFNAARKALTTVLTVPLPCYSRTSQTNAYTGSDAYRHRAHAPERSPEVKAAYDAAMEAWVDAQFGEGPPSRG